MVWQAETRQAPLTPPEEPALDDKLRRQIRAMFKQYPTKRAVLLPALHRIQQQHRCLSPQALAEVAELLELSPAEVMDTASFYDMYSTTPRGRHVIGVCESLSCELCGGGELLTALRDKLGVEPGQTTADGKFTLITMQCLGACDFAPAVLIDETLYKCVTTEQLDEILGALD
ncbi:MAG: NADH-quinone oxidoreductase subunit NuoE [Sedimentisphaerales bacterium]|nr:NADH-quinone oxidoreductase subunit NuoE [Sedimentisphaerales bacterium]